MQSTDPSVLPDALHPAALLELPAAVLIIDAAQRILFVNRAFGALTGIRPEEIHGHALRDLLVDGPDDPALAALHEATANGRPFRGELLHRRSNGVPFRGLLTLTPLRDEQGTVVQLAGVVVDVTDRVEPVDRTRWAAEVDRLTGLATRPVLQRRLAETLEGDGEGWVGVVHCAVDRFEWINDGLGHAGGDEALRRIADALRSVSPPEALVCRARSDEFVVLLPSIDRPEAVRSFGDDLTQRFLTPLTVAGRRIHLTLSIGSAVARRTGPATPEESSATAERILHEADAAMLAVKEGRRAEGLDGTGVDLLQLDADLHDAMDRGDVVAAFQPQYDARTGTLTGYEALARWHHPVHGDLPPDRFIPLAEADGLITRLGDRILEQACRFAEAVAAGRPLQIQVNVSVQQLRVRGLSERIREVLSDYPDRTWCLNVEITESSLIRDPALVLGELEQLREMGVGVSIDDFGSGYSSLSQLRDLPATELKIDKSFVHREDAVGTSLLTAIVALAETLELLVVAEGIENGSQLARLRALGCDRLQGMYLCPPLVAAEALMAPPDIVALLPESG